jgi:hypothetical protein
MVCNSQRCTLIVCTLAVFFGGLETAAADEGATPFRLYVESGFQMQSGVASPLGQLTGRYRFADHWYVDVMGKSGAVLADLSGDDQLFLGLGVGPGFSTGEDLDGWEFRVSPRFTHIHHASFKSWGNTPGSNLAGDSNGGVSHRSGAELAVGVNGPQFGQLGDLRFLWNVDALANYLPSSVAMRFGVGAVVGLSLRGW